MPHDITDLVSILTPEYIDVIYTERVVELIPSDKLDTIKLYRASYIWRIATGLIDKITLAEVEFVADTINDLTYASKPITETCAMIAGRIAKAVFVMRAVAEVQ